MRRLFLLRGALQLLQSCLNVMCIIPFITFNCETVEEHTEMVIRPPAGLGLKRNVYHGMITYLFLITLVEGPNELTPRNRVKHSSAFQAHL